jgi:hypothetical protein
MLSIIHATGSDDSSNTTSSNKITNNINWRQNP